MPMPSTVETYAARAGEHTVRRDAARRVSLTLSRWRLATFLPAFALLIWGLQSGRPLAFGIASVLFLIFFALVVRHARVDERAAWFEALRVVNQRAIARIERHWDHLPQGDRIAPAEHPYADDLDVFGRASLYQWIGPAATATGADSLARWLLEAANPEEIRLRQRAVEELSPRDEWREHLAAFGAVETGATLLPI